jgi:hypothetical protein
MRTGLARMAVLGFVGALAWGWASAGPYEAPLDVKKAGRATFTAQPKVEKSGAQWKVTFAVSAATDVEVAVLGQGGKIVRHLAAGLLGPNAPAPLTKDALSQELVWDGQDDLGRPVTAPARVRVRLGTTPQFDRILAWDGNTLPGSVIGLVVGQDGEVFVLCSAGSGATEMRVFDRNGKYRRTIMPYPANLAAERVLAIGQLTVGGERLPLVYNAHGGNTYPLTAGMRKQQLAWNPKGFVMMVSAVGTIEEHGPPRHLLALSPDGGAPTGYGFLGPEYEEARGFLGGAGDVDGHFDHLAVSPDGESIYFAPSVWRFHHAVFRLKWNEPGKVGMEEGFVGWDWVPGSDDGHLNDPQGLAVDKAGNLYVCDRGNHRVMVFTPKGALLAKFAVDYPEQIAVHPETGAIYVASKDRGTSGRKVDVSNMSQAEYDAWRARERERAARRPKPGPSALRTFSPLGPESPREVAKLDLDVDLMAIDPSSAPAKLWVTTRGNLVPITDQGAALDIGAPVNNRNGLNSPAFITADPERNRLLVRELWTGMPNKPIKTVNLKTGAKASFLSVTEVALAPDGTIWAMGTYGKNNMLRFNPDGSPLNFQNTTTNQAIIGRWDSYGPDVGVRGHAVTLQGDCYVIRSNKRGIGERGIGCRVDVIGPDGRKKGTILDGIGYADCGIGVDAKGNIYLGTNVKTAEQPYPREFASVLPANGWVWWSGRRRPWSNMYYNPYLYHWGSVFKFGPEGGGFYGLSLPRYKPGDGGVEASPFVFLEKGPADSPIYKTGYLAKEVKVAGAQWRYPGVGPVPTSDVSWGDPSCCCITSRLAVDLFGRVYAPDVFRFSVQMLDTNGNQVHRIGRYGNADSAGPKSAVPEPAIAFAWPAFVAVAGDEVYVSDPGNRRITVVRLDYDATAEARVQ